MDIFLLQGRNGCIIASNCDRVRCIIYSFVQLPLIYLNLGYICKLFSGIEMWIGS